VYSKDTVFKAHLGGRKHKKADEELKRVVEAAASLGATSIDIVHPRGNSSLHIWL
jgi:hypothetical protein